jgi:hypothetical protein
VWGNVLKQASAKHRSEHHYQKASNQAEDLELNNGHRENLTSCFTLHVFLRMPKDWFDTYQVSHGKVFRTNIME